jgi:hypothetical protein
MPVLQLRRSMVGEIPAVDILYEVRLACRYRTTAVSAKSMTNMEKMLTRHGWQDSCFMSRQIDAGSSGGRPSKLERK